MPRRRGEPIYLDANLLERVRGHMAENNRTDLTQVARELIIRGLAEPGREGHAELEIAKNRAFNTVSRLLAQAFQRWTIEQTNEIKKLTDNPERYLEPRDGNGDPG